MRDEGPVLPRSCCSRSSLLPRAGASDHDATRAREGRARGRVGARDPQRRQPASRASTCARTAASRCSGSTRMNGVAWNVARDELVISTNTDRHARPTPEPAARSRRSRATALLALGPPGATLAGTLPARARSARDRRRDVPGTRRASARRARRGAAHARRASCVARTLITPRDAGADPVRALAPAATPTRRPAQLALEASIARGRRSAVRDASRAESRVAAGASDVELLVHPSPPVAVICSRA